MFNALKQSTAKTMAFILANYLASHQIHLLCGLAVKGNWNYQSQELSLPGVKVTDSEWSIILVKFPRLRRQRKISMLCWTLETILSSQ